MTPRFAQHVDPLFMRVFDLCERIEARADPSPVNEHRLINDCIRRADVQLSSSGKKWEFAKYALVSWIDEVLLSAEHWSGHTWWADHTLEWEHFQGAESNEHYYQKANEAAQLHDADDVLETYYVCFRLGFRGLYRPDERSKDGHELVLRKYGLPNSPDTWASGIADVINQRRREKRQALEDFTLDRTIDTAQPLWGKGNLLWPWLIGLLLVGLSAVIFQQWS